MNKQPNQPLQANHGQASPAETGRDLDGLLRTIVSLGDQLHAEIGDRNQSGIAATIADAGRSLSDLIGAARDLPAATRRAPESFSGIIQQPHRELSILVAEDNGTSRMVIAKILERAGHRVSLANDGNTALIALRDAEFDVVLMDVDMPNMNGIEATKLYRFSSIGRPRVPILGLTMESAADAELLCLDAGMDGCVTKPVEPERLLQAISEQIPAAESVPALATGETVVAFADQATPDPVDDGVVDMETLANLERLGGHAFVADLVSQFSHDAGEHLRQLQAAASEKNAHHFREVAHALRSSAANVGATKIFEMCLSVRAVTADELATDGESLVRQLESEIDRALAFLKDQILRLSSPGEGRAAIRVAAAS